jgi:hypothetical protein
MAYAGRFCYSFFKQLSHNRQRELPLLEPRSLICLVLERTLGLRANQDIHLIVESMTNSSSLTEKTCYSQVSRFCRAAVLGLLTALPLCGLVIFFDITQPARVSADGLIATELASLGRNLPVHFAGRHAIARFKGVSAEVRNAGLPQADAHILKASDAAQAFARAPYTALKVGFQTEFVTKEHRRVALRIVRRDPVGDQVVPDNARLMDVVPVSSATTLAFIWGPWLFRAEIEDRGFEPDMVVQKVL